MHNLGQYLPQQSPVHSLDPRVKIFALLVFSIIILQADTVELLTAAAAVLAVSQLARIRLWPLLGSLQPVLIFFVALFLIYIFFTPGQPLPGFPIGPVQITYEGLMVGFTQVGKFMLLILAASILTMTTTQTELTMGLERLLRPVKITGVSSHDIALMMALSLRFIPELAQEMKNIRQAQAARGGDFNSGGIKGKIKSVSYLALPLAVNIFRRSEELISAMEARGYQPGSRTYLHDLALRPADYGLIAAFIAAVTAVLV